MGMIDTTLSYPQMLRMAYEMAKRLSQDPDTQNGAILFSRSGDDIEAVGAANQLPEGIPFDPERVSREGGKYTDMEHAERNCIYDAWMSGVETRGALLVCPWVACCDCARTIVAAKIGCVLSHKAMHDMTPERWMKSVKAGDRMMAEAGIERVIYDGPIGEVTNLFDGKIWFP